MSSGEGRCVRCGGVLVGLDALAARLLGGQGICGDCRTGEAPDKDWAFRSARPWRSKNPTRPAEDPAQERMLTEKWQAA